MENTFIQNVSDETITAVKKISAHNLPNRPSAQGMRPDDIKKAFYEPILNAQYSAIAEINRVIGAINEILSTVASLDNISDENKNYPAQAQAVIAYITRVINGLIISADKLADNAVTAGKIHNGAVTEDKLEGGAITNAKLGLLSVAEKNIQDNAVTADKINNGAVTENKLAIGSVTEDKLALSAVTEGKIKNKNVTKDKLADGAVAGSIIEDGGIPRGKLAENSVIEGNIQDGAVTEGKLAKYSVSQDKLSDNLLARLQKLEREPFTASYDAITGDITFEPISGASQTLKLPLELIIDSGEYDEINKDIVLHLANDDASKDIRIPVDDMLQGLMDYIDGIKNSVFELQKAPPLSLLSEASVLCTPTLAIIVQKQDEEEN